MLVPNFNIVTTINGIITSNFSSVCTNLMARVSYIQGHEIRIVLYARLDSSNCRLYKVDYVVYILIRPSLTS